MDFLEGLKKQAQEAADKAAQDQQAAIARDSEFRKQANPTMLGAYHYLRDFVDTLEAAPPSVVAGYRIEGYGMLGDLLQHDYLLKVDDAPDVSKLSLSFVCSRDETMRFLVHGRAAVDRQRDYLWKHGMLFTFREEIGTEAGKDFCGDFRLEAHVRVAVVMELDPAARRIRVVTKNLEYLGSHTYLLEVNRVDEAFLEELAKVVLRKPNRFAELMGFKVPDDVRARLRARLEREAREKGRQVGDKPASSPRTRKGFLKGLFRRR